MKQKIEEKEVTLEDGFRTVEEVLSKSTAVVINLVGSVDAFQRHVLPTFKPAPHEIAKVRRMSMDPGSPQRILEEVRMSNCCLFNLLNRHVHNAFYGHAFANVFELYILLRAEIERRCTAASQ